MLENEQQPVLEHESQIDFAHAMIHEQLMRLHDRLTDITFEDHRDATVKSVARMAKFVVDNSGTSRGEVFKTLVHAATSFEGLSPSTELMLAKVANALYNPDQED